jgi:hypothetical protein
MTPLIERWPRWFRAMWPDEQKRWAVLQGYLALATHHEATLTDIALRNNVFAPNPERDVYRAGIAEGRRQCALEIFKLANIDTAKLFERTKFTEEEKRR